MMIYVENFIFWALICINAWRQPYIMIVLVGSSLFIYLMLLSIRPYVYSCLAYCCVGSHLELFWFSWNLGIIIFILSLEWALLFIWAYDCMIFIDSSLVFIMTIILMSFYISPLYQAPGIFWHLLYLIFDGFIWLSISAGSLELSTWCFHALSCRSTVSW